jgi:hypothetical protein
MSRFPESNVGCENPLAFSKTTLFALLAAYSVAEALVGCTHMEALSGGTSETTTWIEEICDVEITTDGAADSVPALAKGYSAKDPQPEVLEQSLLVLKLALAKYPVGACKCVPFWRLILVSDLKGEGTDQDAFAHKHERTIVLSLDPNDDDFAYKLEREFNHEFFHLFEFEYFPDAELDYEWVSLNYEGFEYGLAASDLWHDPTRSLRRTTIIRGFLSQYGTLSPADDKAEIFSFLLTDPWFVSGRTVDDKIISDKVKLLKDRLGSRCGGRWRLRFEDDAM